MKYLMFVLFSLFSSLFFSGSDATDYGKLWKQVEKQERTLPKTAYAIVEKIYELAKNEGREDQLIKAVIYKAKLAQSFEDNDPADYILELEEESTQFNSPATSAVYASLLGELYSSYGRQNAYRFSKRTDVADHNSEGKLPFNSLEDIQKKSFEYYLESLEYVTDTDLEGIEILIHKDEENANSITATTISQLLHFRAIQHFNSHFNSVSLPINSFAFVTEEIFSETFDFKADYELVYNDYGPVALRLFQQAKTLPKLNTEQRIWLEVNRLDFVRQKTNLPNKETLYTSALLNLGQNNRGKKGFEAAYCKLIAHHLAQGNNAFHSKGSKNTDSYIKAANYLKELEQAGPDKFYAKYISSLKNTIVQKEYRLNVEQVNLIEKPFLALLNYRNTPSLQYKVVKLEDDDFAKFTRVYQQEDKVKFIEKLPAVQDKLLKLAKSEDYSWHSIEFALEGLEAGRYVILVQDEVGSKAGVLNIFHVSNLALIATNNSDKGKASAYVVDRISGDPIQGATVEVYSTKYNHRSRLDENNRLATVTTNGQGRFEFSGEERSFYYKLKYKADFLDLRSGQYHRGRYPYSAFEEALLFTDRAIYRPGQRIYFKGIVLKYDTQRVPSIAPHKKVKVIFRDANWQVIKELTLTSNAYGSFNDVFTAPEGVLNGQMQIETVVGGNSYQKMIRVEEYKRPKLFAEIDKLSAPYKLGDELTITGKLKSFSGSSASSAKVKYRIERQGVTHYRYFFREYYPDLHNKQQVARGVIETDADGSFKLEFLTKPAAVAGRNYAYTVHFDITDITGESVSTTKHFTLTANPFRLETTIPSHSFIDDLEELKVTTKNSENEKVATDITLEVSSVTYPTQVKRNRYWTAPELEFIDEKKFRPMFPFDAWGDELDMTKWKTQKQVLYIEKSGSGDFSFDALKQLEEGVYKIVLTAKDDQGRKEEQTHFMSLSDKSGKALPTQELWLCELDAFYQPGDVVNLDLSTPYQNAQILYSVSDLHEEKMTGWMPLSSTGAINFSVTEEERGGFIIDLMMIKNNRVINRSIPINVPWTNKELTINYSTFRDKLEPGIDEEWTLEILDAKGKDISGELLAAMYDASLDQFVKNEWTRNLFPIFNSRGSTFVSQGFRQVNSQNLLKRLDRSSFYINGYFPRLNTFGLSGSYRGGGQYGMDDQLVMARSTGRRAKSGAPAPMMAQDMAAGAAELVKEEAEADGMTVTNSTTDQNQLEPKSDEFGIRENLNETVFFYPEVKVDNGKASLKFKMNEALTKWNLLLFAHNKELQYVFDTKSIVTQKALMIEPHMPRFIRQGDMMIVNAKVSNLTEGPLKAESQLEILDAITGDDITDQLVSNSGKINSELVPATSQTVEWTFKIPATMTAPLLIKMWTKAGNHMDGEQNLVPVLTNRMLVTETLPMHISAGSTKTFGFEAMDKIQAGSSLTNHNYSLEFTVNPSWIVVKTMPYLTTGSKPSSTELINAYYGNLLMKDILEKNVDIRQVISNWKQADLKSQLTNNQDLKLNDLDETPWVREALQEEAQRAKLKLFLDNNYVTAQLKTLTQRLQQNQSSNGGFSWMPGGRDSWYVTQNILEKLGHLSKLGITEEMNGLRIGEAIKYIDARFADYDKKRRKNKQTSLDPIAIHYLYVRSLFPQYKLSTHSEKLKNNYLKLGQKQWMDHSTYQQALLALAAQRYTYKNLAADIMKSLQEKMIQSEELGNYWNDQAGYYWYNNNIEKQAVMIELFSEMKAAQTEIDQLKLWLLKNKQTNSWKSTRATASACYAFMLDQAKWFKSDQPLEISLPLAQEKVTASKQELGTGYFKKNWSAKSINKDLQQIKISNPNKHVAWGAAYWQYFEDLDKIESFEKTPLTIKKEVYKVGVNDAGEILEPITQSNKLIPGDRLRIRIQLVVDRPMEFIEMKDMRSSGLEPMNVLSEYKWQDGLSYYESTKDLASYFYFDRLPKGNWVFEYDVVAAHVGQFSNGITQIQSMYAPEFSSHSAGISIEVTKP